jgi:hypothetical protein
MRKVLVLLILMAMTSGCFDYNALSTGDLAQPTDMRQPLDFTVVDLTPPLDFTPPPDLTPPVPRFKPDIQADIDALGCASSSCHAVSAGVYMPLLQAAPGPVAEMQNYTNLLPDIDTSNVQMSLMLTKNLAGSGITHAGSANIKPFADTNDLTYKRWLYWMQQGDPYQ